MTALKIAKQASCIDMLEPWTGQDEALAAVTAFDALFDRSPMDLGDLARKLAASQAGIRAGTLYARLSRVMTAIELNAGYFHASRYAPGIHEHVAAHRSFRSLLVSLSGVSGGADGGGAWSGPLVNGALLEASAPAFLAEAAIADPSRAPLAIALRDLERIVAALYADLCRRVGPARADKALSAALDAAWQRERGFNPRRFL